MNGVKYDRPKDIRDSANNVYSCVRYLSKGGFSKVYLITQNKKKLYSGKFIDKSSVKEKHHHAAGFLKELKIQQGIKHENILAVKKCIEDAKYYCLVLEYCENHSLSDLVKRRKGLTDPEIRYYGKQILTGVNFLHTNNIIHRDLKPHNMLINQNMILKIADFGLATTVPWKSSKIPKRSTYGTPNYISPEMINKRTLNYNYKIDLWALGCVFYDMFVGSPPFAGNTVDEIYQNIRTCTYQLPVDCQQSLKDLISTLLNLIPSKRPDADKILLYSEYFQAGLIPNMVPQSSLYSAPHFRGKATNDSKKTILKRIFEKTAKNLQKNKHFDISNFSSVIIRNNMTHNKISKINTNSVTLLKCTKHCTKNSLQLVKKEFMPSIMDVEKIILKWNESQLEAPNLKPLIWIDEFLDCTKLFNCVVYKFSNNVPAALYSDGMVVTNLLNNYCQCYNPKKNVKSIWALSEVPTWLRKKLDNLQSVNENKLFAKYKNDNNNHFEIPNEFNEWTSLMPQLVYFDSCDEYSIMVLSTGLFQLYYYQTGMKMLLCPRLKSVTVISKNQDVNCTFSLNAFKKIGHPENFHWALVELFRTISKLLRKDRCFICNSINKKKIN